MQQLHVFTDTFLRLFGVDTTLIVLGNTVSAYAYAFAIFLFALAVLSLAQLFAISWIASIAERTKTDIDDAVVKMVHSFRPPFYLFVSFWIATQYLTISGMAERLMTGVLVLWLVYQAVIVVGIAVEEIAFRHLMKDQDETTKGALHLVVSLAKGIMWVLGLLLIFSNFGFDVTSLLAGAGIAGIAIAFAMQGILSDLFSSFSLYFDKPFRVGEFVIVGDMMGTVKHIGIKSTRVQALSGEEITISNQELTKARIHNFGAMKERRVLFTFGIRYETPLEQVKMVQDVVQACIEGVPEVRFDRAHFKSFGESALEFEVVYYLLGSDYNVYMQAQQNINLAIMERFAEMHISFAYPTRTVYTHPHV